GEVLFQAPAVDIDLASPVGQKDAGDGGLAPARAQVGPLLAQEHRGPLFFLLALFRGSRVVHGSSPLAHFVTLYSLGCWAWCSWVGPAKIFSFFICLRPSRLRGTMRLTACSRMRSGCVVIQSLA